MSPRASRRRSQRMRAPCVPRIGGASRATGRDLHPKSCGAHDRSRRAGLCGPAFLNLEALGAVGHDDARAEVAAGLAAGEIHNSEHADPRDLRSGQDGHPDRRVAGAMRSSSTARSTYMQPSRRESHRPLRSMPPSLCYAGKAKVQRARRRTPAASLRPCGRHRPARPAAGTTTISTRASDRKTACRDESGLMATPLGCG